MQTTNSKGRRERNARKVGNSVVAGPVDEQDREDEHDALPHGEEHRQGLADHPSEADKEGDDEEGDLVEARCSSGQPCKRGKRSEGKEPHLDGRSNRNAEREVNLVLDGDCDGRDVLGGISDQTDEKLRSADKNTRGRVKAGDAPNQRQENEGNKLPRDVSAGGQPVDRSDKELGRDSSNDNDDEEDDEGLQASDQTEVRSSQAGRE